MPEWLVIARREFLERVRTKWFIIVTILGPLLMIGIIVVPAWLSHRTAQEKTTIDVVDQSGHELFPEIVAAASRLDANVDLESVAPTIDQKQLEARIRDKKINGFLLLPKDALDGGTVVYRGDNATNFEVLGRLESAISAAAISARARAADLDPKVIAGLFTPQIKVSAVHDNGTGQAASAGATFIVGYAVMFILYMAILLYAVNVMRSVVQEKTSRVVEILVSAVKPRALMLGKVIGVGSVGIVQLAVWAGIALALLGYREQVLGFFGIHGGGQVDLPSLQIMDIVVVLAYFALGFFFYAALYAGIGAMVSSEQEAQQVQSPLVMLLIIPVVCVQLVTNDPRGGIAEVLTMIPFSSPVLMPMRWLLGGATVGDLVVSLAILAVCLFGAVALAARIYRVGILMYGKRPSLRELGRWLRYS